MRIFFFNRFFFPDSSATSQIASGLAFALASEGYEVHAIASRSAQALPDIEVVNGVTIHRTGHSTKTASMAVKAIDYARYYFGAKSIARRLLRAGDMAIVKTD